jgi:hypothetical protein
MRRLTTYISLLIFFAAFIFSSCGERRTPVTYELPYKYTGWVTVKFEKPNAPPLVQTDGRYYIKISDSGFAETSSKVEEGLAEDEYYWMKGDNKFILRSYSEENTTMIHGEVYSYIGFQNFVNPDTLEIGKEITLYDGSKVTKLDDKGGVSFESGRPLLFKFYVSEKMENVWDYTNYHLPPVPKEHEEW